MLSRTNLSLAIYLVPTLGLLGQGMLYVIAWKFMPYHGQALGLHWDELSAQHQGFLRGVIRGMGAGSVTVSVAILVMLSIPFRRREAWSVWAVPLIGVLFSSLTAFAAFTIENATPAITPWRETIGLAMLYLLGAVVTYLPTSKSGLDSNEHSNR